MHRVLESDDSWFTATFWALHGRTSHDVCWTKYSLTPMFKNIESADRFCLGLLDDQHRDAL